MNQPAVLVAALLTLTLSACSDANDSSGIGAEPASRAASCEYPEDGQPVKPVDPPPSTDVANKGTTTATLQLTAGDIKITLDREKAPCAVNSFLSLAQQGYFDGTDCHRLTDYGIFILQCGDPSATGRGGPGYVFADEVSDDLEYTSGTVAMANRGPDTNGSQFFLVWDDSQLDPAYTVFGQMDEAGLDVVRGIAAQGVDAGDGTSPIAEARIEGVTVG